MIHADDHERAQGGDEDHADGQYGDAAGSFEGEPSERLAELERECEELRSLAQRAQADYQNLRRRAQSDLEAGLRRSLEPLLQGLLLVLDNLDMALASPTSGEEAKNLAIGVEMTRKQLAGALEAQGVEAIPPGGTFDPERHQAVARVETDEHPDGAIVETVRTGYVWRQHVLRYAQVVVAAQPAAKTD